MCRCVIEVGKQRVEAGHEGGEGWEEALLPVSLASFNQSIVKIQVNLQLQPVNCGLALTVFLAGWCAAVRRRLGGGGAGGVLAGTQRPARTTGPSQSLG